MYINKALIYGNLTKDPELRSMPSGMSVASLSIATNRVWTSKEGKQESTDYHNVVVFGKQADSVAQFLKKGSGLFVEGRMQTRSWESDGVKKYKTEIVAESVQFGPRAAKATERAEEDPKPRTLSPEEVAEGINVDDIPF